VRIALLQINTTVGDLDGNAALIADGVRRATTEGAHLVLTPELSLMGYLPRDLLMNPGFVQASQDKLCALARDLASCALVFVGAPPAVPNKAWRFTHDDSTS